MQRRPPDCTPQVSTILPPAIVARTSELFHFISTRLINKYPFVMIPCDPSSHATGWIDLRSVYEVRESLDRLAPENSIDIVGNGKVTNIINIIITSFVTDARTHICTQSVNAPHNKHTNTDGCTHIISIHLATTLSIQMTIISTMLPPDARKHIPSMHPMSIHLVTHPTHAPIDPLHPCR